MEVGENPIPESESHPLIYLSTITVIVNFELSSIFSMIESVCLCLFHI